MSGAFVKAALVTGGSGGIGQAVAKRLASDGFAVAVHYSARADDAQRVVDEINGQGGRAGAVQADVADAAQVERLMPLGDGSFNTQRRTWTLRPELSEKFFSC